MSAQNLKENGVISEEQLNNHITQLKPVPSNQHQQQQQQISTTANKYSKFNSIIPMIENNKFVETIDAEKLHKALEIGSPCRKWTKRQIVDSPEFKEGEDYTVTEDDNLGTPKKTYHVTTDTAKKLAMKTNSQIGIEVRNYFTWCEKKYQQIIQSKKNSLPFSSQQMQQIQTMINVGFFQLEARMIQHIDNKLSQTQNLIVSQSMNQSKIFNANFQKLFTDLTTNFKSLNGVLNWLIRGSGNHHQQQQPQQIVNKKAVGVATTTATRIRPKEPTWPAKPGDVSKYFNLLVLYNKESWNSHKWNKSTQVKIFEFLRTIGWVHGTIPDNKYVQLGYVYVQKQKYFPNRTKLTRNGAAQLYIELRNAGIIV